jgi:hypothetical protein
LLPHLWTLFARLFTLYHLSLQDFYTIALLHLQSFRFFGCSNIALHSVAHTELQLWAEMQLKKIISLYQPYSTLHCSNKWHCQASFETLGLDLFLLHPGDMQHWSWNRRFRVVQCGCNYWHKACSKKKTCVKTNTMRNTNPITRNYLIQKNASTGNLQAPPRVQPPSKQGLSITMNHC